MVLYRLLPGSPSIAFEILRDDSPSGLGKELQSEAIDLCHGTKRTDSAVVLQCEFHDLADLPSWIFIVNTPGIDVKRSCVGNLVKVWTFARIIRPKGVEFPVFAGHPSNNSTFDIL